MATDAVKLVVNIERLTAEVRELQPSREVSLAATKLEEAEMWLMKAIEHGA